MGFLPVSALLLDQNDETTKFRCNSAIEMTDYDRANLRKANKLNRLDRIPIQTIKDELKVNGLLNRNEIREYLISKYGLNNGSLNDKQINDDYLQHSKSLMNNLVSGCHQPFVNNKSTDFNRMINHSSSTLVPNAMPSTLHSTLNSTLDTLSKHNLLTNDPSTMPLHPSLSNVNPNLLSSSNFPQSVNPISTLSTNESKLPTNLLLNTVSDSKLQDGLASFQLINKSDPANSYSIEDDVLEQELMLDEQLNLHLDEQLNLLLNEHDKQTFNFYKNEFLTRNISLDVFVYSICHLLDTDEKVSIEFCLL